MKVITPVFKDERDKIAAVATILLSLFFVFIPALLVVLFLKEKVSVGTYEIAKAFLNFELMLFIISLFFAIPIIGWLLAIILAPLMCIYNAIIVILALCAVGKGAEVKIPVWYEFV